MKNLLLSILVLSSISAFSQGYNTTKFGKDYEDDLRKDSYEIDPEAGAVILFDKADIAFKVEGDDLALEEQYHIRVKVLKKSELDRGDISFSYYHKNSIQDIQRIKATSYNLEDGKIVETKLSRKDIFTVKEDDKWSKVSFSIPNVKEGTVFEYSYQKVSKGQFTIPTQYFESSIPTLYSQLDFTQPEWFQYSILNMTRVNSVSHEKKDINYTPGPGYRAVNAAKHIWVARNTPALKAEPFVTTLKDYRSQIRFKLSAIEFPNQARKTYNTTWKKVVDEFRKDEDLGGHFTKNNKVIDLIPSSLINKENQAETAKAIYSYLQENITWDEYRGIYCFTPLKKVLAERSGSLPEINLLYTRLLQGAGITANPLLISTRSHGAIEDLYPNKGAFNAVITYAVLDEKPTLINAVSDYGFNLPHTNDLGLKGLLLDDAEPKWVNIKELIPRTTHFISVVADITTDGDIVGSVVAEDNGYAAAMARKGLKDKSYSELLMKSSSDDVTEMTMDDIEIENDNAIHKSLICKGSFEIPSYATAAGDFIYVNPVLFERVEENYFKSEKRTYPVDFPYPYTDLQMYSFNIPEGYEVQELPKPVKVSLPNKGGDLLYAISFVNGKLDVISKLSIKRTVYTAEEYESMKRFFDLIVENHSTQVVLKKTGE